MDAARYKTVAHFATRAPPTIIQRGCRVAWVHAAVPRRTPRRPLGFGFVLASTVFSAAGCKERPASGPAPAASRPAASMRGPPPATASSPASQPVDAASAIRVEVASADAEQDGWLRIEALYEHVEGGWASAHCPARNRIGVETEHVHQFSIDVSALDLDWGDRVWMRINRHSFELARKRHPVVHLRETRTGAWEVVEVHND